MRPATRCRAAGSAAAAILLALGACGGTDGGDGADAALDSGAGDADAQALVFAECMRDNGVEMPDPAPGQQGLAEAFQAMAADQATIQQAMTACEDLMPQYASEVEHDDEVMLDLAECLREQGLEVSDEPFDDAHSGEIDVTEFSAAMEVCRQVLLGGGE